MLNPWIIEEIMRREREKREQDRPVIEAPVESPYREEKPSAQPSEPERGVYIMDI